MDITGYLIINIICHFKTPTHLSSKSSLLVQSNKAISKRLKAARRAVKRRNSQKNQCQEKNTQLPLEGVIELFKHFQVPKAVLLPQTLEKVL